MQYRREHRCTKLADELFDQYVAVSNLPVVIRPALKHLLKHIGFKPSKKEKQNDRGLFV